MKRGISPIVATVLLVIIAVAAGVLIWAWLSGFATKNPTQQPALEEKIKIEALSVKSVNNTTQVTVYVRNLGGATVLITDAYLLDTSGNVIDTASVSLSVEPGKVNSTTITFDYQLASGATYILKLVTSHGSEVTYTFVAP